VAVTAVPEYRTTYTVKRPDRAGEHRGDMEGTTHAVTGLLLGAGVDLLSLAGTHGISQVPAYDIIGRAVLFGTLTAGFALLPDADHPKASFAYAAGALSHGISHVLAVVSGGHRQGMHSLAGIAVMSLVTAACADWWPNKWALGCLAAFIAICLTAGLKATGFVRHGRRSRRSRGAALGGFEGQVLACALAAASVYFIRADLWWLVALGMGLHVFEDEFTGHGCALLWPLTSRRFGGDGRQPAARRPASPRPPAGPAPRRAPRQDQAPRPAAQGPSKPACPACWMGNCGNCEDKACGCPQLVHPARPKRRSRANTVPSTVIYEDDDLSDLLPPREDVPPF
jgi:membrane-bound metal-dependent hydrolase YbcI (DUF457 family)